MSAHYPPADVSIIGGGVIGLSLAWELSQRGKRVRVLDSNRTGRAASWAGAGILPAAVRSEVEDPLEQLRQLSHQQHPLWAEQLTAETGMETGFSRCGGLHLAITAAESATLVANQYWWHEHDIEHRRWSADEAVENEPALEPIRSRIKSAWFLPDECQLRNPWHLKALRAACLKRGVEIIADAHVERLQIEDAEVTAVHTDRDVFRSGQVCICSGAWARLALDDLELSSGLMPVRGQMVLYRSDQPLISRVVNEGNRYMVARADGRLLAGSIEEEVGYDTQTTDEAIAQIRRWAESILPQLSTAQVESSWAGLRPGSYDGFPYIGQIAKLDNLFIAAGHFRAGLHLSPGTAVVMSELICGQAPRINLSSFRPGRG